VVKSKYVAKKPGLKKLAAAIKKPLARKRAHKAIAEQMTGAAPLTRPFDDPVHTPEGLADSAVSGQGAREASGRRTRLIIWGVLVLAVVAWVCWTAYAAHHAR